MVHSIIFAVGLALLAGARAEFNFTPIDSFYEVEGIRVPNLHFQNGSKVISYSPPSGWRTSGGGKKVEWIPPEAVQAGAVIEARPAREFADEIAKIKGLREQALEELPRQATQVEIIEAKPSELVISGRGGVELLLSYTLFAQQFKSMILWIPHDREWIRISFTARASDFAVLEKVFRRSLYSMEGL